MARYGHSRFCALAVLLLLAVFTTTVRARSPARQDQLVGGLADGRFWQGVLNRTLEGNVQQAFNMVFGRVSDDIATAMNRVSNFLDGVRRNVTSAIQNRARRTPTTR
uniref:Putative secreted protein n=1 Tax=Amblyomma cajennense TaxID=34607 RepID=A0A023FDI4_AMBCJ